MEISLVKNPQVKKVLIATTNNLMGKVIRELLTKGKKYEALSYYSQKAPQIPPSDEMGDIEYLLTLSQAASDLGLGRFAMELLKKHQNLTAKQNHMPVAPDDLDAQIKNSERQYVEAKALWIEAVDSGGKPDAAKIRELLGKVSDESKYSYQKHLILGLLDEKEGNPHAAIAHASKAQLMRQSLRVDAWLAQLEAKTGDSRSALKIYRTLEKRLLSDAKVNGETEDLLGLPALPSAEEIVLAEGDILEKFGRWGEAASTYSRAITNGLHGDQLQYEYARTLLRSKVRGERAKAKQTLEKLATSEPKSESDIFWKKLAGEALANTLANKLETGNESKGSLTDAKEGKK